MTYTEEAEFARRGEVIEILKQRIAELEANVASLNVVIDEVRIACDEAGCMIGTKYCDFISSQAARIAELEADKKWLHNFLQRR